MRQPAPIRPCRGSPASHAVAGSTSSGAAARSSAARAAVFSLRDRVAPTAAERGDDLGEQHAGIDYPSAHRQSRAGEVTGHLRVTAHSPDMCAA